MRTETHRRKRLFPNGLSLRRRIDAGDDGDNDDDDDDDMMLDVDDDDDDDDDKCVVVADSGDDDDDANMRELKDALADVAQLDAELDELMGTAGDKKRIDWSADEYTVYDAKLNQTLAAAYRAQRKVRGEKAQDDDFVVTTERNGRQIRTLWSTTRTARKALNEELGVPVDVWKEAVRQFPTHLSNLSVSNRRRRLKRLLARAPTCTACLGCVQRCDSCRVRRARKLGKVCSICVSSFAEQDGIYEALSMIYCYRTRVDRVMEATKSPVYVSTTGDKKPHIQTGRRKDGRGGLVVVSHGVKKRDSNSYEAIAVSNLYAALHGAHPFPFHAGATSASGKLYELDDNNACNAKELGELGDDVQKYINQVRKDTKKVVNDMQNNVAQHAAANSST